MTQEEKELLLQDLKWVDMETNECHCYNCKLFDSKNNVCKCIDLCKNPKRTYQGFYTKYVTKREDKQLFSQDLCARVPLNELNEYQDFTNSTAIYPADMKIIYPTLGLVGEAGEVADKVKKVCRDNNKQFDIEHRQIIAKELGDVLWYVAALAYDLGFTLQEIAEMNIKKLSSRKERNVLHGEGDDR